MIEIPVADGQAIPAYCAEPEGLLKGAVIVIREPFEIDDKTAKLADFYASKGYLAVAPALPASANAEEEPTADETEGDQREAHRLAYIQASVNYASDRGKVAIVGYGKGGYLAYLSGMRVSGLACAIGYYGEGIVQEWRGKRRVPTLLHFGSYDERIPFEQVTQFRANRPDVSIFDYPAGHDFDEEERKDYHPESAFLAQERTLFWISQFVEGQAPIALKNAGSYAQAKTERKKKKPSGDDQGPPE